MPEEQPVLRPTHPSAKPWYRQQLILFIFGSIVIALMLVALSLAMYASSGAAQLDLSRPGYKSVQNEVDQSDSFQSFPADGPVSKNALDQFQKLYDKQTKLVQGEAYNSSALDDSLLGIDAPTVDSGN
jgi:hypothetical protein